MKALLIAWILTILAIAANAQSPVSVSGHAMIPDASATQNTSIRFELTGCDKGQARVPGVAVFSDYKKDFLVNSTTGAFSGTLYANAVIDCNGTLGATKYNVTVLYPNRRQNSKTVCYVVGPGAFVLESATPCS